MAKAEKTGKKAGAAREKVSRLEKAIRKLNGTSAKTPFSLKSALFTVTGFRVVPDEIPGYLVKRTATHTIFRHKKTSASKQMVVSVFHNAEVLALLGDEKGAAITLARRKAFISEEGTLSFEGNIVTVTSKKGETAQFDLSAGDYEIKAADAEGSQASGRGAKSEDGGKKKAKVTDIKEGKKKAKK